MRKVIAVLVLVATLASVAWGMNGYMFFDFSAMKNGVPNVSIAGGGIVPRIPCFGMNALQVDIMSLGDTTFVEVGVGWGWSWNDRCSGSFLAFGPALVGGFPGAFGVTSFTSKGATSLSFHIKGSLGWNPCDSCDRIWTFEVRGSLKAFLCCDSHVWGVAHYKAAEFCEKMIEFWDLAIGCSPIRCFQMPIYILIGADSWMDDPMPYLGLGMRCLSAEIIAKAYLDRCIGACAKALVVGGGLSFNLRL